MTEHEHTEPLPGGPELSRHLGAMHGYYSSNDLEDFTATHNRLHAEEGRTVTIEVTLTLELGPDEVWPDTGVPEGWTVEDVLARALESGTFRRFLEDWEADLFGAEVGVHAKGKYARGSLR